MTEKERHPGLVYHSNNKPDKYIHFYSNKGKYIGDNNKLLLDWESTNRAIMNSNPMIHTTQMGLMSLDLEWYLGYNIYVTDDNGTYQISCLEFNKDKPNINNNILKEIRPAHNIFKMWCANSFA